MPPAFSYIALETISTCNRTCPTCIRNSHPDRGAVASWFEPHLLDEQVVFDALDQAVAMDFHGGVCLSYYNEPLMDDRIPAIAAKVKGYDAFSRVFLNTNGDFLTEDMAAALDGALDRIIITLYMDEPAKSRRAEWMTGLFNKTEVHLVTKPVHVATHFSPAYDVAGLARQFANHPCLEPAPWVIINHRQQYLLCCDDVVGAFDLGTFPEVPLSEHWLNRKVEIIAQLAQPGGRQWHPYCRSCPRP